MNRERAYLLICITLSMLFLFGCGAEKATSPVNSPLTQQEKDLTKIYRSSHWGFSLSYPKNWRVQERRPDTIEIFAPSPLEAAIGITVFDGIPLSATVKAGADTEISAFQKSFTSVNILVNKEMSSNWDWYQSVTYYWSELRGNYKQEVYYKKIGTRLFKVNFIGDTEKYDTYGFDNIAKSFHFE